jgi:hypothetical protein
MEIYLNNSMGGDIANGAHQETFRESRVYFYYLMKLMRMYLWAKLWER